MQMNSSFPLLIRPEPLFTRSKQSEKPPQHCHSRTKDKHQYSLHSTFTPSPSHHHKQQVNWLKYNALVSIYDNWMRLAPFIRHLLGHKHKHNSAQYPQVTKHNHKQIEQSENQTRAQQLDRLIVALQNRRKEMNQIKQTKIDQKDTVILRKIAELSKQIINSLPAQSKAWNNSKIHKHNRIIDEYLTTLNQEQFAFNFGAIVNSLKDRLRFIEDIQQDFNNHCLQEKSRIAGKLDLLKKPFTILTKQLKKENPQRCDALLKALVSQTQQNYLPRPETHNKRCKYARNTVYRLNHKAEDSQKDKNTTFQSTIQGKQSSFVKSKGLHNKNSYQASEEGSIINIREEGVDQLGSDESWTSIHLPQGDSTQNQEDDKIPKINFTQPFSGLLKPRNRMDVQKRISMTYNQAVKLHRGTAPSNLCESAKKTSIFKKDSYLIASIEEIQESQQQQHFSKHKSHRKIGTMKMINNGERRGRLLKESQLKPTMVRESNFKPNKNASKIIKTQKRRDVMWGRQGNMIKKVTRHFNLDIQGSLEQNPNWQNMDLSNKRMEIVLFLQKVLEKGLLNDEKHLWIKNKAEELLSKCSSTAIENNRNYALLMQEKSFAKKRVYSTEDNISQLLKSLHQHICTEKSSKSSFNGAKLFLMKQKGPKSEQNEAGSEVIFTKSVEEDCLRGQIHRVKAFKAEEKGFNLAIQLVRLLSNLQQKEI